MRHQLRLLGDIWSHPANQGRRARTVARSLLWQLYRRVRARPVTVTLYGGLRLRCHADSVVARLALYFNGLHDFEEMRFLQHYLRPGDGVLDVGANIGLYTLLAASRVGPSGRVDAFEPGPLARQRLEENVALNALSQVHVHAEAVGERAGQVRFTLDADDTNRMLAEGAAAQSRVVEVPCVRLDEAVGARRYALGKMDVEGAEPLALEGAGRMLREGNPPVWLLELNGLLHAFGWTEERLAGWLETQGYGLALYDAQARQLRWEAQAWRTRPNVLAVSRQALAHVEERLRTAPRE